MSTGARWFDISTNNKHATIASSGTYINSGGLSCLAFIGTNDKVTLNTALSTNFCIDMVFLPQNNADSYGTLLTQGNAQGLWYRHPAQCVDFYDVTNHSGSLSFTNNQWWHFVYNFNNGTGTMYRNGQQDPIIYTGISNGPYTFDSMGDDPNTETFKGMIANLKLYNRTLTSGEISQNYNAMKGRFNLTP
jgi:hypothetical protein